MSLVCIHLHTSIYGHVGIGQSPYPGKTVDQVIERLRDQIIMKKPRGCAPKV